VLSLATSGGLLAAQVQGSRPTPYLVSITWSPPTERQWRVVDAALRTRVGLAAYLLAGELPAELADVFAQARTPLFPVRWKELTAKCNCPDAENPCKHIAAVLYLFADRLDDDPWLLLEWRGRSRSDILTALGLDDTEVAGGADLPPWWPLRPGEPPSAANVRQGVGTEGVADPPDPPDAVLRRLDELDVVAWSAPVSKVLQELYAAALRAR